MFNCFINCFLPRVTSVTSVTTYVVHSLSPPITSSTSVTIYVVRSLEPNKESL